MGITAGLKPSRAPYPAGLFMKSPSCPLFPFCALHREAWRFFIRGGNNKTRNLFGPFLISGGEPESRECLPSGKHLIVN